MSFITRQMVGRCHVSESNLSVIRYVLSRMKKGAFRKAPKADRREILEDIIKHHQENQNLFRKYRF